MTKTVLIIVARLIFAAVFAIAVWFKYTAPADQNAIPIAVQADGNGTPDLASRAGRIQKMPSVRMFSHRNNRRSRTSAKPSARPNSA